MKMPTMSSTPASPTGRWVMVMPKQTSSWPLHPPTTTAQAPCTREFRVSWLARPYASSRSVSSSPRSRRASACISCELAERPSCAERPMTVGRRKPASRSSQ